MSLISTNEYLFIYLQSVLINIGPHDRQFNENHVYTFGVFLYYWYSLVYLLFFIFKQINVNNEVLVEHDIVEHSLDEVIKGEGGEDDEKWRNNY